MTKEQNEVSRKEAIVDVHKLILYNDDVNTFDYVIDQLVVFCNHTPEQAEQCAWIVHTSGSCIVKESDKKTLDSIAQFLLDSGLTVDIK